MIRKWFDFLKDPHNDLREQMFRITCLIAIIGLALVIVVSAILGEDETDLLVLTIAMVILMCITGWAVKYKKISLSANIIAFCIIGFVLPVAFLTTGGADGGTPIWFIFCFAYISLIVTGKARIVFLVLSLLEMLGCYWIDYHRPLLVTPMPKSVAFIDQLSAVLFVSLMISILVIFQIYLYERQRQILEEQKKEIEDLVEAQNRFFSSMSHEIRTPINSIIGLDEMILRDKNISDEVVEDAQGIAASGRMLLTLINDILDMSKIEAGNMEIVPVQYEVGNMLSDIVNLLWSQAKEKGLEFHINVDEKVPARLRGDEVRIKQILINVLTNAIKYTHEGSVTLSIQSEDIGSGKVIMSYSVEDTGMGIKKENIEHLFTAFKRMDQEKNRYIQGTGLGLSIVKQFVDLMDGEITVDSIYTKGSTFLIKLPQSKVDNDEIGILRLETRHTMSRREHYKQSFEAPGATILAVDDNDTNLMVVQKLLRDTGMSIDLAGNGEEAISMTLQKKYDIILMDHLMPEMDGVTALHRIRSQIGGLNKDTPMIILTANAGSGLQEMYRAEGFDDYVLKPINGSVLEECILRQLPRELVHMTGDVEDSGELVSAMGGYKKKLPVIITTDSVCDIPEKLLARTNILVHPYHVRTEKGIFLDGIETESDGILSYMDDNGKRVFSEAPDKSDYEVFFAEALSKAQQIIHITMAAGVSDGFANATEAAASFDNVIVVDSHSFSTAMGILVLYADKLTGSGMSTDEIVSRIKTARKKLSTTFVVGNTNYLARAGRISKKINTLCRAFLLHPVIVAKDGNMNVLAIHSGRKEKARKKYVETTLSEISAVERGTVFITYAGMTFREVEDIKKMVKDALPYHEVMVKKASSAIAVNCGPGSFGILYMKK